MFVSFQLNMKGTEPIQLDHCYAKPWNWRQEMAHCKPIRVLFAEDNSPIWCVSYLNEFNYFSVGFNIYKFLVMM